MTGALKEGVTATDLALHVTEMLRKQKVVGKFVEFYGPGATSLSLPDRATIANMAPEYGATMGYFPVDAESVNYLRATGRTTAQLEAFETYFKAQKLFGIPTKADGIIYSSDLELDLGDVSPSVAGPKRPQDRIRLPDLKEKFLTSLDKPVKENGFDKKDKRDAHVVVSVNGNKPKTDVDLKHGSVLIAAITSCTNTSNPSVMIAAGLLAKKAVERGLTVNAAVKTSLAPGSRVVTDYFEKTGLAPYLDKLGFQTVGYGCTTCIGNSGPLDPVIDEAITKSDLVAASVLSGNRNFEARVHPSIKANFLMSPPLVVAFALAGRVDIDLDTEPLGIDKDGKPVYLKEIWPTTAEVKALAGSSVMPDVFRKNYGNFADQNPAWNNIKGSTGETYAWDEKSTYIQEPPFFEDFSMEPGHITEIVDARPLGIFGDSVTTDHISPAGSFKATSPAGKYLVAEGVPKEEFNSYGSRRGNDRVMTRGTFANVRVKNLMAGVNAEGNPIEGGVTKFYPGAEPMSIYDASMAYQKAGTPLVIIAGLEYGTGSSRDWAAKGTRLLGVKAVIAQSFERIHRSNLVGMGVLPLCFKEGTTAATLKLDGTETYSLKGIDDNIKPRQDVNLEIKRADGKIDNVLLTLRIDTPIEVDYYQHGGILPYVLRQIIRKAS
jgi:aconitate hydratase